MTSGDCAHKSHLLMRQQLHRCLKSNFQSILVGFVYVDVGKMTIYSYTLPTEMVNKSTPPWA